MRSVGGLLVVYGFPGRCGCVDCYSAAFLYFRLMIGFRGVLGDLVVLGWVFLDFLFASGL